MKRRILRCLIACLVLLAVSPAASSAGKVRKLPKQYHKVEKGETLGSIADLYGTSVKELKSLNHIRKPRRLRAGARILVRARKLEAARQPAPAEVSPSPPPAEPVLPEGPNPAEESVSGGKDVKSAGPEGGGSGPGGIKERLVQVARKMIDIPYRYGGASFIGIDCSAYVRMVYGLFDVVLPRTAREQFHLGRLVGMDNLSIGDLVFFRTYADSPSHVGIYLGDNQFIHASSKDRKVKIDSLTAPYYIKRFVGARRIGLEDRDDGL